jgi:hypothetical protein
MLSLVATPIGNLGDMTPRALDALRAADVPLCEDTRRTWALLSHFGIPRPAELVSYRQGNEERVGARLLDAVRAGRRVALCSDGGCPGISDPGFRLAQAAADAVALGGVADLACDREPDADAVDARRTRRPGGALHLRRGPHRRLHRHPWRVEAASARRSEKLRPSGQTRIGYRPVQLLRSPERARRAGASIVRR